MLWLDVLEADLVEGLFGHEVGRLVELAKPRQNPLCRYSHKTLNREWSE
jgi:hypothetical protein